MVTLLPETVQTPGVLLVSTTLDPDDALGAGMMVNGVSEKLRVPGLAKVML